MKKIILLISAVLFCASAYSGDFGTDSIFASGTGSRAYALGEAFTAAADDSSAVHYNPAGLVYLEKQQISLLHYPMYSGTLYNSAAYGNNILEFGAIGAAFYRAATEPIEAYDANDFKGATVKYEEYRVTLSYAKQFMPYLSAGVNVNAYNMTLANVNATGFGADIGIMYEPFPYLRAGLMIRNFMKPSLQMQEAKEELPQCYALGGLYVLRTGPAVFNLSADVSKGEDYGLRYGAGLEAVIMDIFSLRGGYSDAGLGFGGGVKLFGAEVDYAYVMNQDLGGLSRFTASYNFGLTLEQQKVARQNELKEQVKKLIEEEFRKKEQEKAKVYYAKARELKAAGDKEGALEQLDMALEWAKDYSEALRLKEDISRSLVKGYYDSAMAFYDKKDYVNALEMFKKVSGLSPSYQAVEVYLERVNNKLTVKSGAKKYFTQGLEDYVNRRYDDALEQFKLAKAADPENKVIASYIEKSKKQLGGSGSSKKLTAAQRESVKKMYQSGLKKYTEGSLDDAVSVWKEALKINPEDVKILKSIEKAQAELSELKKRGIK